MTTHTTVFVNGFSKLEATIKEMEMNNWEVAGIASDDGDFAIVFKKNSIETKPDITYSNLDDLAILQGKHFGE